MATLTVSPDADPETTSVDGWAKRGGVIESWADLHDGVGTEAQDTSNQASSSISSYSSADNFNELSRPIILFDASALPSAFSATAGQVRLYVDGKTRTANWGALNPTFGIYASTPASNTAVIATDYSQVESTLLSDTFAYDDITENAWLTFTLNAAGLAAIVDGIVKLAFRISYDATDTPPAWAGNSQIGIRFQMADKAAGNPAELIITYIEGSPSDAMVRVTGLVHRWSAGPNAVYQLEILTGGLFSQYFSPVSAEKEPEPTIPSEIPPPPVYQPTFLDYAKWLVATSHAKQIAIFGVTPPEFNRWKEWMIDQLSMGKGIL